MVARLILASLVLGACEPPPGPAEVPGQAEAVGWGWPAMGGHGPAPSVAWVLPPDLDCASGVGWELASTDPETGAPTRTCVAGAFWSDRWQAKVAMPDATPLSRTALMHELCHAVEVLEGLGDDYDHHGPCFVGGGRVDRANARLAAEGE